MTLASTQPVNKFPSYYETRQYIRCSQQHTLGHMYPVQFYDPLSILSSHLSLEFQSKTEFMVLYSQPSLHWSLPCVLHALSVSFLLVWSSIYKNLSMTSASTLQSWRYHFSSNVTSPLARLNIPLSSAFTDTLLLDPPSMQQNNLHPHTKWSVKLQPDSSILWQDKNVT